jgi:hypothetical protein
MLRTSFLLFAFVLVFVGVSGGCSNPSERAYDNGSKIAFSDTELKEVQAEIAKLARGKSTEDIEGTAIYSEAVTDLTRRGSRIESTLIETLAGNPDWAIRMGVIEVLGSLGTRRCVDTVIAATGDVAPLVSLHANKLLEVMTNHRVIPEPGQETSAEGLPPVPQRSPDQIALNTEERLWAGWHQDNSKLLQATWKTWWKANRGTVDIQ